MSTISTGFGEGDSESCNEAITASVNKTFKMNLKAHFLGVLKKQHSVHEKHCEVMTVNAAS